MKKISAWDGGDVMEYLLMNKDNPLVFFEIKEELGAEVVRNEKVLSPVMPPWFDGMAGWLENRNYAKHKEHLIFNLVFRGLRSQHLTSYVLALFAELKLIL